MKTKSLIMSAFFLILNSSLLAQVPQIISYQGRVAVAGVNFDGSGRFKFALVNAAGNATFWSNDGTSVAGSQPTAQVTLTVTRGLYSVLLGDTSIAGMTVAIPATVFNNSDVRLRIWFNDNVSGFQLLSPDQRIASVGYAMLAVNVPDGAITATKLADGAVTAAKLAPGAVTSATLADTLALGNPTNAYGRLDIYRAGSSNTPAITLDGIGNQISTYGDDGKEQIRLWGPSYGEIYLYDNTADNNLATILTANGSGGGILTLNQGATNIIGGQFWGDSLGGGRLLLRNSSNQVDIDIRSQFGSTTPAAWMTLNDNGSERVTFAARNGTTGRGGLVDVKNNASFPTVKLIGDTGGGNGRVNLVHTNNVITFELVASEFGTDGSQLIMRNAANVATFEIDADFAGAGDAEVRLRNAAGVATITLDADSGGSGRITTQILQITGGSDLSEQFNIKGLKEAIRPGMVVCIDPKHPGELVMSSQPYDRRAAGVISGAGGVKPGMLMGQKGTVADGEHPVALTGRVYCLVDSCNGPIEAGDLLTTSSTPGHAMKVTDHVAAQGAIIGKAMGSLETGKGLVLVLVSLQ